MNNFETKSQGRHSRFWAGKTAIVAATLPVAAIFYFEKSRQDPGLGSLASCGGPYVLKLLIFKKKHPSFQSLVADFFIFCNKFICCRMYDLAVMLSVSAGVNPW